MRHYFHYVVVASSAAFFSAALYLFVVGNSQNAHTIDRLSEQVSYMRLVFLSSSVVLYGTIDSVVPNSRLVRLRIENRYRKGGEPALLELTVPQNALLARQSLLQKPDGSAYTGLSPAVAISIQDIRSGERAAVVTTKYDDVFQAYSIIVGNPL